MSNVSKKQRVLNALLGGSTFTAKQISARYNSGNPYEVIRQIRKEGYTVTCDPRTNSKGETKYFYSLAS